jgi:mannose-1-phosphate guanylyltransferase
MKSMILAAGFGTRLRPLTDRRPKALMPVANRPILAWSMDYLRNYGATGIIINAHHHQEQMVDYVRQRSSHGLRTEVSVEPEILGTGGGIKNVEDFFGREPFVVMNVDVLTDIDLEAALRDHKNSGALVTLVLHDCGPYNQIQVDKGLNITDIGKTACAGRLAFTGIHIIDPAVLPLIPAGVFSDIIPCYRDLIRDGKPIKAYVSRNHYWRDIGSISQYMEANRDFAARPFLIGSDCRIHPSVRLEDWAVIGDGCRIEESAIIRRSVLWERVDVQRGVAITDTVINSETSVGRNLQDEISEKNE